MCIHGMYCLPLPRAEPIPNLTGSVILDKAPSFFERTIPVLSFTVRIPFSSNLSAAFSHCRQTSALKSFPGASVSLNNFSDVAVP